MAGKQGRWLVVAAAIFLGGSISAGGEDAAAPVAANDSAPLTFTAPDAALAAAPAPTAAGTTAPVDTTHPADCPFCALKDGITKLVPWLSMGADFRFREHYAQNIKTLENRQDWHFQRYRTRLWWKVSPCDNLSFNFRLVFEPIYYQRPEGQPHPDWNEAIFDEMNFEWKKFLGLPVTLKVGRQDISLGDKWLFTDGTPLDGTRTAHFDAVRATITCDPKTKSTLDLIYLNQRADTSDRIKPFNDQDKDISETNTQGVIVYGSNKSIKDTTLDPYFAYKHDEWTTNEEIGRASCRERV
jgi:hypothetical protein